MNELECVTGVRRTRSLFQAKEGGATPTVTLIEHRVAAHMIEKFHYSHRMPTGKNICFGWWLDDDELYAVAVYGIGVNPFQASMLRGITDSDFLDQELLELKRCVRVEPPDAKMPLTKFLSVCHRHLRKIGYKILVAFSDPAQGHTGGLYLAGNWRDAGVTNPEWHLRSEDGEIRHRRFAFRHSRRNNCTIAESRDTLKLQRIKVPGKRRFVLWIGK
jgi:hypothetical protein